LVKQINLTKGADPNHTDAMRYGTCAGRGWEKTKGVITPRANYRGKVSHQMQALGGHAPTGMKTGLLWEELRNRFRKGAGRGRCHQPPRKLYGATKKRMWGFDIQTSRGGGGGGGGGVGIVENLVRRSGSGKLWQKPIGENVRTEKNGRPGVGFKK